MKQEYFVYKGKRYNKGDIIIVEEFCYYSCKLHKTKAEFLYYDAEEKKYALKVYNNVVIHDEDHFNMIFCGAYEPVIKNKANVTEPKQLTFKDELNIDGLFLAWLWYVFIMLVAVIFKDCIGIWILASVVFFNYRNKKLKEAGYR